MEQPIFATWINEQLPPDELVRQTLARKEGVLDQQGALCISTGKFTGRSPEDKFIVRDSISEARVDWGRFNHPIEEGNFLVLKAKLISYLNTRQEIWARNMYVSADPHFRLTVRLVSEHPAASHFAANLFIEPTPAELKALEPEWTVIHAPGFTADPHKDGTRRENFTILSLKHQTILIGGTGYTGEIKKSVFTALNFILPQAGVLSMHCSANEGLSGDTALFFGLSGTGKTTLSADGNRRLIGDDEHGWSDSGIFNIEGGCYAKIINLSPEQEPAIYNAVRPGALVENIVLDNQGVIDFADRTVTENTRASYPLAYINGAKAPAIGAHPQHIFFLACDAYGVLPPVSRLTDEQALYYYLNGYTAKIAGTEEGVTEPQVTFSACFGAPFLPLHPEHYAILLGKKLREHSVKVWLVNTGWTAGPYGKGTRISIAHSRAIIRAVLANELEAVAYQRHPVFGLEMPLTCPNVPTQLLNPRDMWTDKCAYDRAARKLAEQFGENHAKYNPITA